MSLKFAVVAVKDLQSDGYGPIYTERNPAIAIRNFSDLCQNKEHPFNKHPKDYALFLIGEYNPETGIIKPYIYEKDGKKLDEAKVIASAEEFVRTEVTEDVKKV